MTAGTAESLEPIGEVHRTRVGREATEPMRQDIRLLGTILGDTVREQSGERVFGLVEQARVESFRVRRSEVDRAHLAGLFDGIDIRRIRKDSLRNSIGMVLQDVHLFSGTVMDNIRYGRLDASDAECVEAAVRANADSFIRRLPEGYDTFITADGMNLSQGQRQLLAIARAAVADPPVLILDEATSSIDTRTERLIEQGLDALMEGRTVFVIAHRLSTVRNADAILVIEDGQIIERGDHEDLLAQRGRYYQLYSGQYELD